MSTAWYNAVTNTKHKGTSQPVVLFCEVDSVRGLHHANHEKKVTYKTCTFIASVVVCVARSRFENVAAKSG